MPTSYTIEGRRQLLQNQLDQRRAPVDALRERSAQTRQSVLDRSAAIRNSALDRSNAIRDSALSRSAATRSSALGRTSLGRSLLGAGLRQPRTELLAAPPQPTAFAPLPALRRTPRPQFGQLPLGLFNEEQ